MSKSKVVFLNNFDSPVQVPFYERRWFILFSRFISSAVAKIPPLAKRISKTIPYLNGWIPTLCRAGNYVEALELSISGLKKCDLNDITDHYWRWSFMSYAVYCAFALDNSKLMNSLISMADNRFEPFEGSNVSYCFCQFSHFKYVQGDYDSAIRLAEVAREADDESGKAYYLLGYYELFINEGNPIEYFKMAIERDNLILARIVHHPSLQGFPNILDDLNKLYPLNTEDSLTTG